MTQRKVDVLVKVQGLFRDDATDKEVLQELQDAIEGDDEAFTVVEVRVLNVGAYSQRTHRDSR